MKMKKRYDYSKNTFDSARLCRTICDDEPLRHMGELEAMRWKIEELARVLDRVVDLLPPDQVRQIAVHFGYEEVKE